SILITPSGRACIAGALDHYQCYDLRFTHSTARVGGETARYQVPEILKSEKKNHRGSDVYAFACVYYETLTGKVPFYELPNDMAVALKVTAGARPSRPEIISDGLWSLLQDCWKRTPTSGPK
ncbi:hypothetical protein B0H13DRAFT_1649552, partial [Mycena leptocephala]